MHTRGDKSSSPSRNNADLMTYKTIDEVTASKGEPSNNDFPRAIYQHEARPNVDNNKSAAEHETEGTAYGDGKTSNDANSPGIKINPMHQLGKDNSPLKNYPYPMNRDGLM